MDSRRYARIKSIFAHAREMPLAQRVAYLDDTCSGEPELRAEIDELLAEDKPPTRDPLARSLAEERESQLGLPTSQPQKIGRYRILGILITTSRLPLTRSGRARPAGARVPVQSLAELLQKHAVLLHEVGDNLALLAVHPSGERGERELKREKAGHHDR